MKNVTFLILSNIKKDFGSVLVLTVIQNFLQCHEFILMEFILVE